MPTAKIKLATIEKAADLQQARDLVDRVWKGHRIPAGAVPEHGGLLLGAFDDEHLMGCAIALDRPHQGRRALYLQKVVIAPHYRGLGIGQALMTHLRQQARVWGHDLMTWTYDPLDAGNAWFYHHKLGAIAAAFLPDHYGPMADGINDHLATDRLLVTWPLTDEPVRHHLPLPSHQAGHLDQGARPHPSAPTPLEDRGYAMAIPTDFQALKRADLELARHWRRRTGSWLAALLTDHQVVDLIRGRHTCQLVMLPRAVSAGLLPGLPAGTTTA